MKLSTLLRIVLPLLLLVTSVAAGPVIFERALPTGPNVNADAPGNATPDANRSNIKWAPTGLTILGDDFILPFDNIIESITVWMVGDNANTTNPNQELFSIRLFTGNDANMTLVGAPSGTYSFTQVTYDNGQNYWNPTRQIFQPIFEVTFGSAANPLNWSVQANTLYNFAVQGLGTGNVLSLHGSNGCDFDPNIGCLSTPGLSQSNQDAPDGAFLEFSTTNPPDGPYELLYAWYSHPDLDNLWDKASDINVRIAAIPEPSTFALLGLGFGALVYFRRRKA
jgi:hypothetical protein